MLYFAYGANTNLKSMAVRCPGAVPIGKGELAGYRLEFKTFADIVVAKRARVQGVVWRITEQCEKSLDRFEGFPVHYRKEYGTWTASGERIMWYAMNRTELETPPLHYWDTLMSGYERFGLDTRQMIRAWERAERAELAREQAYVAQMRLWEADADAGHVSGAYRDEGSRELAEKDEVAWATGASWSDDVDPWR